MSNDCYEWEMEDEVFEVAWVSASGDPQTIVVADRDEQYVLDRAWAYCQANPNLSPTQKEDLKLKKRKLLF